VAGGGAALQRGGGPAAAPRRGEPRVGGKVGTHSRVSDWLYTRMCSTVGKRGERRKVAVICPTVAVIDLCFDCKIT
jgi:hypothetical protein